MKVTKGDGLLAGGVWLAATAVWLFAFSLYGLLASDQQFGYEGEHASQARAYVEGTLTVDPLGRVQPRARGGIADVGQYVPFALAAHLLSCRECKGTWERFWYVWVHPFWSAWTVLMLFALFLKLSRNLAGAISCAIICACGTVLLPYAKFGMETQQTLWTTAAFAALLDLHQSPNSRRGATLGLCLAILTLTKITGITIVALFAAVLVSWIFFDKEFRDRGGKQWRTLFPIFVVATAGIIVLLLTNWWRYGAVLGARYPWGDRAEFPFIHPIRWWAFFTSPNKSVFLFSPILLLTLPHWKNFLTRYRELRPLYIGLIVLVGFHLSMNTWVDERWWFSRLHFTIPFLVLPLMTWWESGWKKRFLKRAVATIVVTSSIVVQLLGSSVNYTALAYVIHPSRELSVENLVWNPYYNHLRFNVWALTSWWSQERRGFSIPFVVPRNYLAAAPPPAANKYDVFPFKGWDTHDFFLLKELTAPDVAYGETVARSALGIGGIGLLVAFWLWGRAVGHSPKRGRVSA